MTWLIVIGTMFILFKVIIVSDSKQSRVRTPTYNSWRAMKDRCNQPTHTHYAYYGARQISYDPEWEEFAGFVADMGLRPPGMTLDRRDNDEGYSRHNCRWATPIRQGRNRRNNVRITYADRTQVLSEWAEETGIPYGTLYARIFELGWPPERAFSTPSQEQRTLYLTHNGQTLSSAEWGRQTGLPNATIRHRIKMLGWSIEKTLTTPVGGAVL